MRKLFCIIISAALVLAFAATAWAGTINVSGTGEVLVPADTAIISLGVTASEKEVLDAQAYVNNAVASIRSALTEAGVDGKDINTGYININALYDYSSDTPEIVGYSASSTLAIRTGEMEKIGEIIDIALSAGANSLDGISFSVSEYDEYKVTALKNAVADAYAKAQILADASDQVITGVENISEYGTYSYDSGLLNNFSIREESKAADSAGTYVQAAKLTVSASINVIYTTE